MPRTRLHAAPPPGDWHLRALADAAPQVFWLATPGGPQPRSALVGEERADLLVVGGGFTGLWAAIVAKERDPAREVVLVEGDVVASGASGRNGGFLEASLTHGLPNGMARWPKDIQRLVALGMENYRGIEATLARHGIDCGWDPVGVISVARTPREVEELAPYAEDVRRMGLDAELLDERAVRAEVDSPTFLGGVWGRSGNALVHPVRLAWGLLIAAERLGVRVYERTRVTDLARSRHGVVARTEHGTVRAGRAVLATAAFPPLARAIRRYVLPVYDYVLVSEPLTRAQRDAVGWRRRQGLADGANQFHYYRLTPDDRVLWGGYDAIYYFGNDMGPHRAQRPETYSRLSGHFFETFPQLEGLRWAYRWGGAIDTCSRFCATYGTSHGGRVAWAAGFTGLGVGASRFGARVALDLLEGSPTELTRLPMVRERPIPFPPEPLRWASVEVTRRALARADRRDGRRGPWLRLLDRVGAGFDS